MTYMGFLGNCSIKGKPQVHGLPSPLCASIKGEHKARESPLWSGAGRTEVWCLQAVSAKACDWESFGVELGFL